MKQHITVGQAQSELGEHYEEMIVWIEEHGYREYSVGYKPDRPFMTIGVMIEFLLDQKKAFIGYDSVCETNGFHLHLNHGIEIFFNGAGEVEFCDALWEAVKEVLEK